MESLQSLEEDGQLDAGRLEDFDSAFGAYTADNIDLTKLVELIRVLRAAPLSCAH